MLRSTRAFLLVALALLASSPFAFAIIKALTPLRALLNDAQYVLVGKVEKLYPEKPALVLGVVEDLKGKAPFRQLPINFKGDAEAEKEKHVPQLLKRLGPDLPVVMFVNQRGKRLTGFVYTNGTWFQVIGQQTGSPGEVAWSLTHGEPYLRRTFKGPTDELKRTIVDALSGKAKPPEADEKVPPGFGPELAPAKSSRLHAPFTLGGGPGLFGVIPTLGVGAPIAILALLFPAVFGGVLVLFRQWLAFITVLSLNSTILLVHWLVGPSLLRGTWWNTDAALWFVMTVIALGGVLWAWRRQLANLLLGPLAVEAPRRTEYVVLTVLTVTCVVMVGATWLFAPPERNDLSWALILVLSGGIVAGTLYRLGVGALGAESPLATEGVIVLAILCGHVGYAAWRWGDERVGVVAADDSAGTAVAEVGVPHLLGTRWAFTTPPNQGGGMFVSSPFIDVDRLFVASAHPTFKGGALYCLDRHTGKERWMTMGANDDLKQMISSPTLHRGRLYIGEGFHDDPDCRVFCIDPESGKELWTFKTTGQTEATPCGGGDKVYAAAGNDGIYCLDAEKGTEVWRYPPQPHSGRLLRCGSNPLVLKKRLYAGSAVDRNRKDDPGETSIFCLDAATGQQVWKVPTPLPSWAGPVVRDGRAFYALGNGDLFTDAPSPAGLMLCVEAETGKEAWRFPTPNGILTSPAVDAHHVYFGCRDGHVYCVGRHDGGLRWKTPLGSPAVASPALARCGGYNQTAHVFAVAAAGKLACLDPNSGEAMWSVNLAKSEDAHFSATPQVVLSRSAEGDVRQIYVCGAIDGLTTGRPVVYCLEDLVKLQ